METPIALIIDDPSARVFVYYEHGGSRFTADGRPLQDNVPNAFLCSFCDVIEARGIKGKFSIVPMPGGRGRLDTGIPGIPYGEITEWLDMAKARLSGYFAFCPEVLTHAGAIDLDTMQMMEERENVWSFRQTAATLTPYIALSLRILKNCGIDATGVTSPWDFGIKNEDEYAKAIALAMEQVWGRKESWYFCRSLNHTPNARPWIAYRDGKRTVVSIPGTIGDHIWQSMDTTDTSDAYVSRIADLYLTEDGRSGEIMDVLDTGGFPILTTHWQSLFSNGLGTGLRILDTVAARVNRHLCGRVQWTDYTALMQMTINRSLAQG